MDENTLRALWQEPESERIEWKPSLSQTDSIYKAICAFANDFSRSNQEGVIFIGREDNGDCSHIELSEDIERNFIQKLRSSGSILPLPDISSKRITIQGCEVITLIVRPSLSTPVEYGKEAYIRQGNSSNRAKASEISALVQKRTSATFDAQGLNGATFEDLDEIYLKDSYIPDAVDKKVLAENGRSLQEQLAALRILTPQFQPTALGVLVAGKDPKYFLPGAYVQFLAVDGTELGEPIRDSEYIMGRINEVLNRVLEKIRANIQIIKRMEDTGRMIDYPDYPYEALRELLVNAVLHRDYQYSNAPVRVTWFHDRVEISNPGGPYGRVTVQNFGQPHVTDYRNPELATAFYHLGFAERFGTGIAKARRLLRANGNPEPTFDLGYQSNNYVLAIVRKA